MAQHPELEAEQAYVDHAYARLVAMRSAASTMLTDAYAQSGAGTPQAVTERDVSVRTSLARLEQLALGEEALIFGRIDTAADPGAGREPMASEAFHIGRLAVSDVDSEPLVVDWRAPVAEPFYRATGRHPMGLSRRRHFLTHGRLVTDLEDELFGGEGPDAGLGVGGSTVLLKALERSRSGRMRDIVATVQREQDEIIRAPLAGILVVQGGPGTGKTAVALHRAAYLLYTHRFPLERQGVLVVGPNPLFLRYIEHVLPSLGESGVELSTVGGLVHGRGATGTDTAATARVKGDVRMAAVLAKAIVDRERALPRDFSIGFGTHVLRLSVGDSHDIVSTARRRQGTHNARRRLVENLMARKLAGRIDAANARAQRHGFGNGGDVPAVDVEQLARELRRNPVAVEALDRMWPVLTPEAFLHDLFGARPLVELAAGRILRDEERAALLRRRSHALEDVAWTDGDLPLLDEARALLGAIPKRKHNAATQAEADEHRTFGHIVVDEAQDLTPMQLRMLSRRSLGGSMTMVGDIAQATGPFAPRGWGDQLAHLPTSRGVQEVELSVNYRTPAEIMEVASRVLEVAAPELKAPESVRAGDAAPIDDPVGPDEQLLAVLARRIAAEQRAVGDGTIAVIAPGSMVTELAAGLHAAGVEIAVATSRSTLEASRTLVPVGVVKGLEFDSVVVVEPDRVVRESPQGLRALYVALTRATQRLAVVHAEPLPEPMRGLAEERTEQLSLFD